MIDIKKLSEPEIVQKLLSRDPSLPIEKIVELNSLKNKYVREEDNLRRQRNESIDEMTSLRNKPNLFQEKRIELKQLSNKISSLTEKRQSLSDELNQYLLEVPNIIQDDVPRSQNKEDSEILYTYGQVPTHNFSAKDHLELVESNKLVDFKVGSKMAGNGFALYRGKGAILEFALINYMLNHHIKNGFEFVLPPILNNTESLTGSGNLPKFANQIYSCKDDKLHLIPTSEVPLTAMFSGEIVDLSNGPKRLVAYTPCFRREAGAGGQRDKGLIRMHQFNKIETYSIVKPENAKMELEFLVENARTILEELGLHFRVANLPSCDLSLQSSQTYDIEIWLPYQKRYSEVSSGSNCTDYQARRSNMKFREGSSNKYVNTLNCSGLATPRLMVALLETYQNEDGSIDIPASLVPFTRFNKI
jgi:seryl-tRNA synthetase